MREKMSNTLEYLNKIWAGHNFPHAWHVYSEDTESATSQVKQFAAKVFSEFTKVPLENNTDFLYISNETVDSRFITVDQIRAMQNFLSKSVAISPIKIVIIHNADSMNNNAFNSCLKVLEEPPAGCYIFLITTPSAKIPATILSRCSKLYINATNISDLGVIRKQLVKFLEKPSSNQMEALISKISQKKDNVIWQQFSEATLQLISSICKLKSGLREPNSEQVLQKIANQKTINYLLLCYDEVRDILDKTFEQDLDRRQCVILVLNKLTNLVKNDYLV
jgi:DNA polymerase-3 subunit delta'